MWTLREILLDNLNQTIPIDSDYFIPKDTTYLYLKHLTGQDFGYDSQAWSEWFANADNPTPNFGKPFRT